jgi:hypothetical protein
MAEALATVVPELVNEAGFTRADLELALDDRGWINPMSQNSIGEIDSATRNDPRQPLPHVLEPRSAGSPGSSPLD